MTQPVFYQTLNMLGVDPTLYYTNLATAGGSVTPEYPAPPYIPGTQAFGSDGSQFVFVQASTSISLTDFVAIHSGTAVNPFMANSVNTTNIFASDLSGIGASGLVLKQSVSFIPAGAMFWACTKGQFIPATNSGTVLAGSPAAAGAGPLALYVALTGVGTGILTSVSTTLSPGIAGIVCINSLTVSIPASLVPPSGATQSNGFTVGPVVAINNPRLIIVGTTTTPLSANSATQTGTGFAF